jgi:hypothetical protein
LRGTRSCGVAHSAEPGFELKPIEGEYLKKWNISANWEGEFCDFSGITLGIWWVWFIKKLGFENLVIPV